MFSLYLLIFLERAPVDTIPCYRNWSSQPARLSPHFSIFPGLHICTGRSSLLHVFDHFRPIVLIDARRRIDVADIAMRLAHSEIETAAVIGIGGRVHEIFK